MNDYSLFTYRQLFLIHTPLLNHLIINFQCFNTPIHLLPLLGVETTAKSKIVIIKDLLNNQ